MVQFFKTEPTLYPFNIITTALDRGLNNQLFLQWTVLVKIGWFLVILRCFSPNIFESVFFFFSVFSWVHFLSLKNSVGSLGSWMCISKPEYVHEFHDCIVMMYCTRYVGIHHPSCLWLEFVSSLVTAGGKNIHLLYSKPCRSNNQTWSATQRSSLYLQKAARAGKHHSTLFVPCRSLPLLPPFPPIHSDMSARSDSCSTLHLQPGEGLPKP